MSNFYDCEAVDLNFFFHLSPYGTLIVVNLPNHIYTFTQLFIVKNPYKIAKRVYLNRWEHRMIRCKLFFSRRVYKASIIVR